MTTNASILLVLGMHRSGTSAITGCLNLCGAWIGKETELIDANAENPVGFKERRDIRNICDRLLQEMEVDWWKVTNFDPGEIPHEVWTEERRKFARVVSALGEHEVSVIKDPRFCLLLPILRDCLTRPFCIHICRNPLEVARSLHARNGFGIAAGISLWEAYNLHALNASRDLPRVLVSHKSLMLEPRETLNNLVERLQEIGVTNLKPNGHLAEQFIDPALYRNTATDEETDEYLSPSQRSLWSRLRKGGIFDPGGQIVISRTARQYLSDLESTESSLRHHQGKIQDLQVSLRHHQGKIQDLQASLRHHQGKIQDLQANISEQDRILQIRDELIRSLQAEVRTHGRSLQERKKIIADLYNSTSWRITAPLRKGSLRVKSIRKKLHHVFRLLFWLGTGQFSRAMGAVRFAIRKSRANSSLRHQNHGYATSNSRPSIHQYGKNDKGSTRSSTAAGSANNGSKTKISVITWDLGHNPLGRAYLLADVLKDEYDVELIGTNFPRFGNEVWEPLRDCSRVTIKGFPGGDFPEYFRRMEHVAKGIEGDILYVSKPRLPGLELAILAKLNRNRPIILDVDDYELGFFGNHEPLTLDEVRTNTRNPDFDCPHDELWTRYSESLIPLFEQVTVSNEELRKKFGGTVLPHLRDERDFDPTAYPRDAIRAELGFASHDKVILFAGTPRLHKGIAHVVAALKELNHPDYKLLIVGSPTDHESSRLLNSIDRRHARIVPNVPFSDLPRYLCAGDLICLMQLEDEVTSHFQIPAKLTDGLAMGIPVLATAVPPLMNLASTGLVELLDGAPLYRRIDDIFTNYEIYKQKALRNREVFMREYSYGANLPRLRKMIDRLLNSPNPAPDAFHELIAYHRETFSCATNTSWSAANHIAGPAPVSRSEVILAAPAGGHSRAAASYRDDKIDIVFFWKQNDTGIYGRRQDMLVKYLAMDNRIHRILHFDRPINFIKSGRDVIKSGDRHNHSRLVLYQILISKLGLKDKGKIRFDTYVGSRQDGYLDYLDRMMKRHAIGQRRTIFWVCPINFDFPSISDRFQPDLVVADVVDDQREWPISPQYKEKLHHNYSAILARSHLTFANCERVCERMRGFTSNIYLIPNAAELLEEESRHWERPTELNRLKGPIVGYAGNLDISRIDLELLTTVAAERPEWNLVFIGSTHMNKDILKLHKFRNVHFLGARPYNRTIRYIRHFDVAIIPHLDNPLTQCMNPLKLYVYASLLVPIVTTRISNIDDLEEFVQVGRTAKEFIDRIDHCLDNDTISGNIEHLRCLLKANSWSERTTRILKLIEDEFDAREQVTSATATP